jgi:TatD DNase family protein
MWTDTHCHLEDDRMDVGTDATVRAAIEAGVTTMVTIGCDALTSRQAIDVASRHAEVWATVGLHPHEARFGTEQLLALIDEPRVVAIGECGLDYYYEHSDRDSQRRVFAEQIRLAHEKNLTLVIHTRDAWDETLDILDAEGVPTHTVMHCFSGGPQEARRCLDRGMYLSFSGIVTFKNAEELRDAARICPDDRLLIETDSPFLAPVPHRGKQNQPALVAVVGTAIAKLRGVPADELAALTSRNALAAFPRIAAA